MGLEATVTIDPATLKCETKTRTNIGHEGTHLVQAKAFTDSFSLDLSSWDSSLNITRGTAETEAYLVNHLILDKMKKKADYGGRNYLGRGVKNPEAVIQKILNDPKGPYAGRLQDNLFSGF